MIPGPKTNRFQALYKATPYLSLKNHLYNYLLRKKAIAGVLAGHRPKWLLEIGTGISPVSPPRPRSIFTDLSFTGLRTLKEKQGSGNYVVADGTALPFKRGVASHCISSEVIEHIADDGLAMREMSRVLQPGGYCILTFPHRRAYFTNDDAYVHHYRRYDLAEMVDKLHRAGLVPERVGKVLGPLEKAVMMGVIFLITRLKQVRPSRSPAAEPRVPSAWLMFVFKLINRMFSLIAGADAWVMPRSMSAVLLIEAKRINCRSDTCEDGPTDLPQPSGVFGEKACR